MAAILVGVIWMRHDALLPETELAAGHPASNEDPGYASERAALVAAMPARIAALPTEARAGAAEGLAAIHAAEAQLQEAMKKDSSDPLLLELLIAIRQEEMRVMTNIDDADNEERML